MPIQALCFDLDDTLWPVMPVIRRAEAHFYAWLAQHYPRITAAYSFEQLRDMRFEIAAKQPALAHDFTALRKLGLAQVAAAVGYGEELIEPAFQAFWLERNRVDFYPDTLPVLQQLAQHYPLCALSNGNADIQQTGLGEIFSCAFNAINTGQAKPHPAMFEAACQALGYVPEQVAHVGDDLLCDVQGAQQAGMKAVWLNRSQTPASQPMTADVEIHSLWALQTWLGEKKT